MGKRRKQDRRPKAKSYSAPYKRLGSNSKPHFPPNLWPIAPRRHTAIIRCAFTGKLSFWQTMLIVLLVSHQAQSAFGANHHSTSKLQPRESANPQLALSPIENSTTCLV